jgi:Ca2+-binding EF-hand superfamily protein
MNNNNEDQLIELKEVFSLFEEGGFIKFSELNKVMLLSFGENFLIPSSLEKEDYKIDFKEFCNLILNKKKEINVDDPEVLESFKMLDDDNDNLIDFEKFSKILKDNCDNSLKKNIDELLKEIELNDDKKFNYVEFLK